MSVRNRPRLRPGDPRSNGATPDKGVADPLTPFPTVKRRFTAINGRPTVARARTGGKDHEFKKVNDEDTMRSLFATDD